MKELAQRDEVLYVDHPLPPGTLKKDFPVTQLGLQSGARCPVCRSDSWKVGFSRSGRRRCKCKSCGKKFNERTGTPFHGLHFLDRDALMGAILDANGRSGATDTGCFAYGDFHLFLSFGPEVLWERIPTQFSNCSFELRFK